MKIVFLLLLITLASAQAIKTEMYLQVSNKEMLDNGEHGVIFDQNKLNNYYNDTIFITELNCRNDNLEVINNTQGSQLLIHYENIPNLNLKNAQIAVYPNQQPKSYISFINDTHFGIEFNCTQSYTPYNYFNQVSFILQQNKIFSFLLNCDPDGRHKQFQIGYILISFINAGIIVGVAMHSHIWSIKVNLRPLRFQLKWMPFLIFSVIGSVAIIALTRFSANDKNIAFVAIRYSGIIISFFFVFICFNEVVFLVNKLRKPVFKMIRICDLISFSLTILVTVMAFFVENWVYYYFIAGCICVGSIKLFHFNSLKQAFFSMIIMVTNTTILAVILHFTLPLSYNDYAGQLSSPLFFQVPDLVNNLYKKCSWLPTLDVIIAGVMLSYLRVYDQNKSSRWGGIYTVSGNLIFVSATAVWVGIESVYPYSVPFSLITYPLVMLSIFIIAWKRNDWSTLLYGQFQQGYDTIDARFLQEKRLSFGKQVDSETLSGLLINQQWKSPNSSSILTN